MINKGNKTEWSLVIDRIGQYKDLFPINEKHNISLLEKSYFAVKCFKKNKNIIVDSFPRKNTLYIDSMHQ